jgi:hypothetical protein
VSVQVAAWVCLSCVLRQAPGTTWGVVLCRKHKATLVIAKLDRLADKATTHEDRVKFQWLDAHLRGRLLHTITRDEIQAIGKAKAKEASRPTANRYLALVRAVLRQAAGAWQWIHKAPAVTLYPEAKQRVPCSAGKRSHGS